MNMTIVSILVIYIVVTMLLALWVARQNKTAEEMFTANGSMGVSLIIPLMLSEAIGGSGTVGSATEAMASIGMAGVWTVWGVAIGYFAYRLLLGRFYRTLYKTRGIISIPGAYELRFDRRTKIVMLIVVSIVYICFFALQPVAAASVLAPMFGVSRNFMVMALGVLFVIIAALGGLKGVASMNKLHSFVLIFGLGAVSFAAVRYAGGWHSIAAAVPEHYLNPFNPGPRQVLIWAASGMLAQLSSAFLTTIVSAGKSYKDIRIGIDVTALLLVFFAFFPVIIGIVGKAVMPEADPATALYTVSASVSPIIGGLAVVGVLAAIFSSAPAFLLIVTTTFTQDLFKGFIKPNASDRETLLVSKVFTVIIGLAAVYMATQVTSIFQQTMKITQIRSVAAIVLLISLVWPRVNGRSAFWSILCGGTVAVAWYFMKNPPITSDPMGPSVLVGLLVLLLLTSVNKEKVSDGYSKYLDLKEEYSQEMD